MSVLNFQASTSRWRAFGASVRGASHYQSGVPNQDAFRVADLGERGQRGLVAAVADGHGNLRHFRSDRGSRYAVDAACGAAQDAFRTFGEPPRGNAHAEITLPTLVA